MKISNNVCLWGSIHKEKPPKRAVCASGPGGLSRGIIDDVFITRCGLMWGLGHTVCCGSIQVDSAASSLTPVTSAVGADKSSKEVFSQTYGENVTKVITHTVHKEGSSYTTAHSHCLKLVPEIKYLKANINSENNLFSSVPVSRHSVTPGPWQICPSVCRLFGPL